VSFAAYEVSQLSSTTALRQLLSEANTGLLEPRPEHADDRKSPCTDVPDIAAVQSSDPLRHRVWNGKGWAPALENADLLRRCDELLASQQHPDLTPDQHPIRLWIKKKSLPAQFHCSKMALEICTTIPVTYFAVAQVTGFEEPCWYRFYSHYWGMSGLPLEIRLHFDAPEQRNAAVPQPTEGNCGVPPPNTQYIERSILTEQFLASIRQELTDPRVSPVDCSTPHESDSSDWMEAHKEWVKGFTDSLWEKIFFNKVEDNGLKRHRCWFTEAELSSLNAVPHPTEAVPFCIPKVEMFVVYSLDESGSAISPASAELIFTMHPLPKIPESSDVVWIFLVSKQWVCLPRKFCFDHLVTIAQVSRTTSPEETLQHPCMEKRVSGPLCFIEALAAQALSLLPQEEVITASQVALPSDCMSSNPFAGPRIDAVEEPSWPSDEASGGDADDGDEEVLVTESAGYSWGQQRKRTLSQVLQSVTELPRDVAAQVAAECDSRRSSPSKEARPEPGSSPPLTPQLDKVTCEDHGGVRVLYSYQWVTAYNAAHLIPRPE
jgi:hypothetical protein